MEDYVHMDSVTESSKVPAYSAPFSGSTAAASELYMPRAGGTTASHHPSNQSTMRAAIESVSGSPGTTSQILTPASTLLEYTASSDSFQQEDEDTDSNLSPTSDRSYVYVSHPRLYPSANRTGPQTSHMSNHRQQPSSSQDSGAYDLQRLRQILPSWTINTSNTELVTTPVITFQALTLLAQTRSRLRHRPMAMLSQTLLRLMRSTVPCHFVQFMTSKCLHRTSMGVAQLSILTTIKHTYEPTAQRTLPHHCSFNTINLLDSNMERMTILLATHLILPSLLQALYWYSHEKVPWQRRQRWKTSALPRLQCNMHRH